jgi:hypothetical protein
MKYISFFIFFTAFFLVSCEKEIEFKGKEENPKMVLNCILNPDYEIRTILSKSQFFLLKNPEYEKGIVGAKVYLWQNGKIIAEGTSESGGLYGGFTPSVGDKIKITAEHPDYPSIESEEIEIPAPVPVINIDTVDVKCYATEYSAIYTDSYTDGYQNDMMDIENMYVAITYSKVKITFNDPEKIKNYYRVYLEISDKYDGEYEPNRRVNFYSNDIVFGSSSMGVANTSAYNEFNDLLFDGEKYTLTLCFYDERSYSKNDTIYYYKNIPERREVTVRLESLCESYYNYLSSLSLYNSNFDGGFFSEPVQIYSNIKDGMGILGAYSVSLGTIELPKWEKINQNEFIERQIIDSNEFYRMYDRYGLSEH